MIKRTFLLRARVLRSQTAPFNLINALSLFLTKQPINTPFEQASHTPSRTAATTKAGSKLTIKSSSLNSTTSKLQLKAAKPKTARPKTSQSNKRRKRSKISPRQLSQH